MEILLVVLGTVAFCQPLLAQATINVGARLDVDWAQYDDDVTPLDSGSDVRRLRLGLGGKLSHKISYYLLADFRHGKYGAQTSWLRYRADKENEWYAGRLEIPFSLQSVSNSKYNLLMERALPAALTRHYGTGLVYLHKGRQWSWRAGLFFKDQLNFHGPSSFGKALSVRLGRRLKIGDSRLWLAATAMLQDAETIERVSTRPESSISRKKLINSGKILNLKNITRLGVESLWKIGQWSIQGEWMDYRAQRSGLENPHFNGGYLEASRIFNGRRRFNFRSGEWMSPEVTNFKTWELAFRVSQINLQTKTISGGRETNYNLGLNYYFNRNNRLMLNWIKADTNPNRFGFNESPSILQARLQLGF